MNKPWFYITAQDGNVIFSCALQADPLHVRSLFAAQNPGALIVSIER